MPDFMEQIEQCRKQAPGAIILMRVGDFYEAYGSDAEIVSRVLGTRLMERPARGTKVSMVGLPHHYIASYLRNLVFAGHRVAVCEQVDSAEGIGQQIETVIVSDAT